MPGIKFETCPLNLSYKSVNILQAILQLLFLNLISGQFIYFTLRGEREVGEMLVVNLGGGRRIYKQFGMADEIFHLLKRAAPSEREAGGGVYLYVEIARSLGQFL